MADVFLADEHENTSEETNDDSNDNSSETTKENSDMTLKIDSSDSELFAADDLFVNPDDLLPPVVKLEKYANSDIVFNRQVVARNLLETLRLVYENNDEVARVINVLSSISEDYDPSVRTELMVQLPHIAAFCKEVKLNNIIVQYLVPLLLSYLREENNLVRKSSHSALLSILEQGLCDFSTQTEKIWPLILHMTDSINPEDVRTDSILLMSKLLGLMGAEEHFFDRLFALCVDRSNNIRKACASCFGDICTAVGRELTEEVLLPKFFILCEDSAWCVRKACAENFMPVSCIVSREIRCKELASLYMVLLSDQSRWVRVTSYQALGPFISTFAEPDKTGLYYSKDGVLTVVDSITADTETCKPKKCNSSSSDCNTLSKESSTSSCHNSHSSIDKTTSSKFCDNVVPISCMTSSNSPSDVPSISCHVGSYCTVIEVTSPTAKADAINQTTENRDVITQTVDKDNTQYLSHVKLGAICNDVGSCNTESSLCKTLNLNGVRENDRLNQSEEEFVKLWYEAAYSYDDCAKGDVHGKNLNGDMDTVNKISVDNKILDNFKTSEGKQSFCNSITVNGLNLGRTIPLPGPISFEVIPLVNNNSSCSNPNNLKKYVLNQTSKEMEHSNGNIHSTDCIVDNAHNDKSTIVNASSQDSNCTEHKSVLSKKIEALVDEFKSVLKSNSDKPSDDESAFNHFQYWREPVPVIGIDEEVNYYINNCISIAEKEPYSDTKSDSSNVIKDSQTKRKNYMLEDKSHVYLSFKETRRGETKNVIPKNVVPEKEGEPPPETKEFTVHDQDIVPPELLLQYISMIDSAWAQTIDAEIARHCAYSLPAVALTLGRKYWPCLKDTFEALTSELQGFIMMWKVRRTVASAMHQLAVILGPDITSEDLLPVFSRFINDLDEVRVGILQHLYDFLKILKSEERVQFLPSLPEFLVSNGDAENNEKNWRLRLILAEQLVCIADLYEPQNVRDHLVPLTLTLITDKVCEVRLAAVRVMAAVMKRMSQSPTQKLTKAVLNELTEKFVHSPKWLHRQLYVYVCQEFIVENSLSADQFAEDALPQLLYLCWDRVPNVRIAIARCIVTVIWPLDAFSNPDSPHRELLLETIHTLQSDTDADVRYYANMVSTHDCSCLQNGEFNSGQEDSFV